MKGLCKRRAKCGGTAGDHTKGQERMEAKNREADPRPVYSGVEAGERNLQAMSFPKAVVVIIFYIQSHGNIIYRNTRRGNNIVYMVSRRILGKKISRGYSWARQSKLRRLEVAACVDVLQTKEKNIV